MNSSGQPLSGIILIFCIVAALMIMLNAHKNISKEKSSNSEIVTDCSNS